MSTQCLLIIMLIAYVQEQGFLLKLKLNLQFQLRSSSRSYGYKTRIIICIIHLSITLIVNYSDAVVCVVENDR